MIAEHIYGKRPIAKLACYNFRFSENIAGFGVAVS